MNNTVKSTKYAALSKPQLIQIFAKTA